MRLVDTEDAIDALGNMGEEIDLKEAEEWVDSLMYTVKRYHGSFVCLWHNSSFYSMEWKYLDGLYTHIVEDK